MITIFIIELKYLSTPVVSNYYHTLELVLHCYDMCRATVTVHYIAGHRPPTLTMITIIN